jgi:hypothetical protein
VNTVPHPGWQDPRPAKPKKAKPAKLKTPQLEQSDRLMEVSRAIGQMPPMQGALFSALFVGRLSGLSMYKHTISVRQLIEMSEGLLKEVKL